MTASDPAAMCCSDIDLELEPAERRVRRHPPVYWTSGRHWQLMLARASTYRRGLVELVSKQDIANGTLRAEGEARSE